MAKLDGNPRLTPHVLERASLDDESPEHKAIEVLLKGPEIRIDPPYFDKDGHERSKARFAWWNADARTIEEATVIPPGVTSTAPQKQADGSVTKGEPWVFANPDAPVTERPVEPYPADATPVLFGHYWREGAPELMADNAACTDYSACKNGELVAYRWSGERELSESQFEGV